jgi:predicted dehydrogenase
VTRLGIAGLGWLGEALILDASQMTEFQVGAVQDVVPEREREIASRYAATPCEGSFEGLLGSHVDAVVICTPNDLHASQTQQALRAGKDVLVQKPLALSFADAATCLRVGAESGRLLFVDYTYRFLDTMRVLRDRARVVRSVRAAFHNTYGPGAEKRWFFNRAQSGGGALIDLGVHLLDLSLWLTSPASVSLVSAELSDADPVEYSAEVRLRLDEIPFELSVSWNAPLPQTEISFEVECADGHVVRWENVDGSFFRFRTLADGEVLLDRETTLREDTLRAFSEALATRRAPSVDTRVYAILDEAYARSGPEGTNAGSQGATGCLAESDTSWRSADP